MKLIRVTAFVAILLCFGGSARAGQASVKLSTLAESLISGYRAKSPGEKATLAVFQFNCDTRLEKQRVGFAVSELMSHRFVADGTFIVVERGEIGKLLNEQRVQASGVVDSDTAVRLGKLLGAKILLLGNVQKLDGRYQVNARLVDTETSAVIVSGFEELPIEAFEEDARPYLSLVPQEQALGIYFLYNLRFNRNRLPSRSLGSGILNPKPFNLGMMGIGMRYSPAQKMLVDVAYMRTAGPATAASSGWDFRGKLDADAFRGRLEMKLHDARRYAYYAGAGATLYTMHMEGRTAYIAPSVSLRGEFRPQARIGLSLSCNYDLNRKPAIMQGAVEGALLDRFSIEPALSVSF